MPSNYFNVYSELLEGGNLSDRHRKLLRLYLPEISKAEKKASRTKFWYTALTAVTALGGAAVAGLGSLTLTGNAGIFVHWSIFGLGSFVTLCGIIAGRFNFGKRTQIYQVAVSQIRETWVDFFFSIDSKTNQKDQSKAVKDLINSLDKHLGNLSKIDIIEVPDEKAKHHGRSKNEPTDQDAT